MSKDKCVIYVRVSSRSQGTEDRTSLADQEATCRALASDRGWDVLEVVQDRRTGTDPDRPGLNKVLELVERGAATHVLVWDTSRLMRDLNYAQLAQARIQIAGATLHFVQQPATGNDLADAIMRTINYSQDQISNEKRTAATQPKRLEALARGEWIYPAPYGYQKVEGGGLEVNPAEAAVVVRLYELYAEGEPNRGLLAHLNSEPPGTVDGVQMTRYQKRRKIGSGRWGGGTLARLLSNHRLYSRGELEVTMSGETFTFDPEPIVDQALATQVAERRASNTSPNRGRPKHAYMLSGLPTCACGRVWASKTDSRTIRGVYRCPNIAAERHTDCARSVGAKTAEAAVWEVIWDTFLDEESTYSWTRLTLDALDADRGTIEADRDQASAELSRVASARAEAVRLATTGVITESDLKSELADLDAERSLAEGLLSKAEVKLRALDSSSGFVDVAVEYFARARAETGSQAARRGLCHALIDHVLVTRDADGPHFDVRWREELRIPASQSSSGSSST